MALEQDRTHECPSCGRAYEISREANDQMQRDTDEKCEDCGTALEAVIPERGGGQGLTEREQQRSQRAVGEVRPRPASPTGPR